MIVTAKATPGAKAPANDGATNGDRDLSHIRVGPPFTSKIDRPCGCGCNEKTGGKACGIVENSRSGKKRAYLEACLEKRPDLLARRDAETEGDFLDG